MSKYCEDCGTILNGGVCSNCHEELYISTYQEPEYEPSEEWREKVSEQSADVDRRQQRGEIYKGYN